MCEATLYQLTNPKFHQVVETIYGNITTIVNACGEVAESQTYPGNPTVVALSPYYRPGRDGATLHAVECAKESWSRDEFTAFRCKQCSHRGILEFVVTFAEAFGSGPQDRMSIV